MEQIGTTCPNGEKNQDTCTCPKEDCERHGICCECILNHKNRIDDPLLKRLPHCLREMVAEAYNGKD